MTERWRGELPQNEKKRKLLPPHSEVLSVDNGIFLAFSARKLKHLMSNLDELAVLRSRTWKGLDAGATIKFLVVVGMLALTGFSYLIPRRNNIIAVGNALCGGEVDFVASVDKSGAGVWANTADSTAAFGGDAWWLTKWSWDRPDDELLTISFSEKLVDEILRGRGREKVHAAVPCILGSLQV